MIFNAVLIFVPLHIIGVFIAENQDEKGILSNMVNGGSKT
jgi:cytochrome b